MSLRALALIPLSLAIACGHSEEEWKAQLAKYAALEQKHKGLEGELADHKARVGTLSAQLEQMGVQLSSEGSEKEKLNQDIAQMKAALEEYKARAETLERIKQRFELLRKKLQKLTDLGLDVRIRNNRMVISLPGDVLFASGQDTLKKEGEKILMQVAEVIRNDNSLRDRLFQVAGHTDDQPLKRSAETFHDNWGLSLMRARQVLVFLVAPPDDKKAAEAKKRPPAPEPKKDPKAKDAKDAKKPAPPPPKEEVDSAGGGGGLSPKRWSASGYGQTDPVAGNDTPEGRAKNRRVELILMPDVEEMLDLKSLL
ncbi:MAG TPA: OmpA family protein [Polyangiaceae bacterium]|nr:OmpA family protein [Polyangiaceae bacterium]